MVKHVETHEPKTIAELTRLFADAAGEPLTAAFDGVEFELRRSSDAGSWLAALASPFALAAAQRGGAGAHGHAVRVRLPQPVAAELALTVAKIVDPATGMPEVRWELRASDEATARTYLAHGLEPVLRRLGERYRIRMDDRELVLGPLLGTPAEAARDVADLIAVLPRPSGDEAVLPDFDEAAEADGGVAEVGVYDGPIDAELARGSLEASGIPARTVGGGGAGLWGGTAGVVEVRVLVPRSFAEPAERLLDELEATDGKEEGETGADDKRYAGGVERLRRPERLALLELERVVDLCLEGTEIRSALDVGTGTGLFAEAFVKHGLETSGCDVNEELLAAARTQVPDAEFVDGAMEDLPYDDGSFDLVFLGHVLHETDDVPLALAEARRVARLRVAILEWPHREESEGPPLAHRLRAEDVEAAARRAGFAAVERLELRHMVLFRLAVRSG